MSEYLSFSLYFLSWNWLSAAYTRQAPASFALKLNEFVWSAVNSQFPNLNFFLPLQCVTVADDIVGSHESLKIMSAVAWVRTPLCLVFNSYWRTTVVYLQIGMYCGTESILLCDVFCYFTQVQWCLCTTIMYSWHLARWWVQKAERSISRYKLIATNKSRVIRAKSSITLRCVLHE